MRIDQFLNAVNVAKNRSVATDMLKSEVVLLNGVKPKPSKEVKIGDTFEIEFLNGTKRYQILQIPTTKTVPKTKKDDYIKEL